MMTGEADYLLYAGGKAIGVVEAKPQGHTLAGVESQSVKYAAALPPGVPALRLPLLFCYESKGAVTQVMKPAGNRRPGPGDRRRPPGGNGAVRRHRQRVEGVSRL